MPTMVTLVDGTIPVAADFNTNFTNLNNAIGSGTTISTYTAGDILYASATATLSRLAIGTENQILVVSGGLPAWSTAAASDTAAGLIEIAVQSELEAGTSTTLAVTPGRQHFHPASAKCWGKVTYAAGVPTLQASFNVTSITDNGVGQLAVTIATDFSSTHYGYGLGVENAAGAVPLIVSVESGTLTVGSFVLDINSDAGVLTDPVSVSWILFGDQV